MIKSYRDLIKLETFEERYKYLKLNGIIGEETFGSKRNLNQMLYKTPDWKSLRDMIIIRDNGCDLGIEDRIITGKILVHHINPITINDILKRDSKVFSPNNLICVSHMTHEAIHYGDDHLLIKDPIERIQNDTCLWRKGDD